MLSVHQMGFTMNTMNSLMSIASDASTHADEADAGELIESIAAVLINAEAALRWLSSEQTNLVEARLAIERIVHDGRRTARALKNARSPTAN